MIMRKLKFMAAVILLLSAVVCADAQKIKEKFHSDPENHIYVGFASVGNGSSMSGLTMYSDAVTMAFKQFVSTITDEDGKTSGTCSIKYLKSRMTDDSMFYVWLEIRPEGDCRFEAETSLSSSMISDGTDKTYDSIGIFSIKVYNGNDLSWQSMMKEMKFYKESPSSVEMKVNRNIVSSSESEQLTGYSESR